jgi:hypothetical protein
MWAATVVIIDVFSEHSSEVWFIPDQQLVEAFFPDSSYPTLGVGVGCTSGSTADRNAF